jgi:hypothetical protein
LGVVDDSDSLVAEPLRGQAATKNAEPVRRLGDLGASLIGAVSSRGIHLQVRCLFAPFKALVPSRRD